MLAETDDFAWLTVGCKVAVDFTEASLMTEVFAEIGIFAVKRTVAVGSTLKKAGKGSANRASVGIGEEKLGEDEREGGHKLWI